MTAERSRSLPITPVVVVAVLLLAPLPIFLDTDYRSSHDLHAAIEVVGGLIALIAGLTFLLRFTRLGQRSHLLFGVGFLANGSMDLVHGVLPFLAVRGFVAVPGDIIDRAVPATYIAGRVTLALMLLAAPFVAGHVDRSSHRSRVAAVVSALVIVASLGLTAVAFYLPGPTTVFSDRLIARPFEVVTAGIFVFAAVVLLRHHRQSGDVMTWWVALAAAVATVGEITMSFSYTLHTATFDVAHLYKVAGYAIPLLGVSLYHVWLVDERSRYAAALETADRARSDFVSMVSHELRTPIATIAGFTDLVYEDWEELDPDERRRFLAEIGHQSQELRGLVDDLLAAAQLNPGNVQPRPDRIRIRSAVGRAASAIGDERRDLELDVPDDLEIWADPGQTQRMIANLLLNAVKHGAPPIIVEARADRRTAEIVVRDHGDGVSEGFRSQLFEPFTQARSGTTRDVSGVGLGLTIAAILAEAQGGELWFTPNEPQGACFHLRLPRP